MSLTPAQLAAVRRWGQDVCVVAGPGSGKTRVLVERYLWLLDHHQFKPASILVITFTEKAAQELKERLTRSAADNPERRLELERAPIGTIHGFGARLLRRYAVAAGLDPAFRILDERAARLELSAALRSELDRFATERPADFRLLVDAWSSNDLLGDLAELYDSWRTSGGTLADLRHVSDLSASVTTAALQDLGKRALQLARAKASKAVADRLPALISWVERLDSLNSGDARAWIAHLRTFEFSLSGLHAHPINPAIKELRALIDTSRRETVTRAAAPARRILVDVFGAVTAAYERRKESLSAADFGDLETRAISLLEHHPAILEYVRDEFESILMDELQDTNPLQWRLVNLIRRPARFFAVGDINQSIFGFRHADPSGFREYRDSLLARNAVVDYLTGNFRSRAEILSAVTAIVDQAPGIESPRLVAHRDFAPATSAPVEAQLILEDDREIRAAREAEWMARRIREIVRDDGIPYSSIAVLFRSTTELAEFERAFTAFQVPFVLTRGQQFFEQQEIADLVNWLRVLDNPLDEPALFAVLRGPLAGIPDAELLAARDAHGGQLAHALPHAWPDLHQWLASQRALAVDTPPDQLLGNILHRSGYEHSLALRGHNNIDKLLTILRDWWAEQPRPLAHLLRYLEDLRTLRDEPNAPAFDQSDAVQILTVHAAKGLEFPVVFLGSLQRRGDSRAPSLTFTRQHGLGIDWRDPVSGDSTPDPAHADNLEARAAAEAEEANRLLYVAMTRAEQRLIFSTTDGMRAWAAPVLRVVKPRELTGVPPRHDLDAAEALPAGQLSLAFESEPSLDHPRVEWIEPLMITEAAASSLTVTELLDFAAGLEPPSRFTSAAADSALDRDASTELGRQTHWLLEQGPLADPPASFSPDAALLARSFWSSPLYARLESAVRIEREFDFQVEFEGLILSGQIDLWFTDADGRVTIVDFKTDLVDHDTIVDRVSHYALQLNAYALALERLGAQTHLEMYVYFLRLDRAVPVSLDRDSLTAWVNRWKSESRSTTRIAAPPSSSAAPPSAATSRLPEPPSLLAPDRS